MDAYTVVGLLNRDTGQLLVAGVYEGHVVSVDDDDHGTPRPYRRYATTLIADSWEEAERRAIAHPESSDVA